MNYAVRLAGENDLVQILNLFKKSLGDQGGIPDPAFWKWKHEQNPFGNSPTLLAYDSNTLIGLRTFLQWKFRYQGKVLNGYRAVDTATHPDYRGKGIFTKLTLSLIEQLKSTAEPAIIFNTPNAQSGPGYIKMGWKNMGKTALCVKPIPFNILRNRIRPAPVISSNAQTDFEPIWNDMATQWFETYNDAVVTNISYPYLKWRYCDIPGFSYFSHWATTYNEKALMFGRLKVGRIRELRITDVFFSAGGSSLVKKMMGELIEKYKPDVVTLLTDSSGILKRNLPFGFFSARYFGLTITYRELNSLELVRLAEQPELWYFSAGSLELL